MQHDESLEARKKSRCDMRAVSKLQNEKGETPLFKDESRPRVDGKLMQIVPHATWPSSAKPGKSFVLASAEGRRHAMSAAVLRTCKTTKIACKPKNKACNCAIPAISADSRALSPRSLPRFR